MRERFHFKWAFHMENVAIRSQLVLRDFSTATFLFYTKNLKQSIELDDRSINTTKDLQSQDLEGGREKERERERNRERVR